MKVRVRVEVKNGENRETPDEMGLMPSEEYDIISA